MNLHLEVIWPMLAHIQLSLHPLLLPPSLEPGSFPRFELLNNTTCSSDPGQGKAMAPQKPATSFWASNCSRKNHAASHPAHGSYQENNGKQLNEIVLLSRSSRAATSLPHRYFIVFRWDLGSVLC